MSANSANDNPEGQDPSSNPGSYEMPAGAMPAGFPQGGGGSFWRRLAERLGFTPGRNVPVVTSTIIILCVLVALSEMFSQRVGASLVFAPVIGDHEPWRFLGSAFLHAGFWHLLFNMYALWLVGSILEPAIGRVRFLAIYLLSAVAGNVFVLLTADPSGQSWITATVGASGAVFGVFGAVFVLMKHFDSNATSILVVIVANLALGFIPGMNISWQSHVGGLIAGSVVMALMMMRRGQISVRWRNIRDVAIVIGTTAVLVGLIWWAYQ